MTAGAATTRRPRLRVGLDVGGTKIEGVLLGPDGAVVGRVRAASPSGVRGVVDACAQVVEDLLAGLEPEGTAVVASVGAGFPGVVDSRAGTVADAVNLGFTSERVPLAALLSAKLGGLPVTVENDVNATAFGALRHFPDHFPGRTPGQFPGQGDLALLSLGTGLAAGLVVGGRLLRGGRGAAGEIGHLAVDPRLLPCGCGQRGCLETVAAGAALRRRWPHGDDGRSAEHLFAAAAQGDPAAVEVRDDYAAAVALALRALALTCDPDLLVLGGGVAAVGEPLRESVSLALQAQAAGSAFLRALAVHERLVLLPTGQPVAATGAAALAELRELD